MARGRSRTVPVGTPAHRANWHGTLCQLARHPVPTGTAPCANWHGTDHRTTSEPSREGACGDDPCSCPIASTNVWQARSVDAPSGSSATIIAESVSSRNQGGAGQQAHPVACGDSDASREGTYRGTGEREVITEGDQRMGRRRLPEAVGASQHVINGACVSGRRAQASRVGAR